MSFFIFSIKLWLIYEYITYIYVELLDISKIIFFSRVIDRCVDVLNINTVIKIKYVLKIKEKYIRIEE